MAGRKERVDVNRPKLAVLASYIATHKKLFAIDMCLSLLAALVDLAFPYVTRWTMYELLPENAFRTFFIVMVILVGAYLLPVDLHRNE